MEHHDNGNHGNEDFYKRIGELTGMLHRSLRELGYDKQIESAAVRLPDARSRLLYISQITEHSANRVLNAVESAKNDQQRLGEEALRVKRDLTAGGTPDVSRLVAFLDEIWAATSRTNANLTEIMLAQDFQDLTGQTIRKVVDIAQSVEMELLRLLLEAIPPESRGQYEVVLRPLQSMNPELNGPSSKNEFVLSQNQVDELLDQLGF
jgi:chemotaxis protein CheZ